MVARTREGWVYRKPVPTWRIRLIGVLGFIIGVSLMVALIIAIQQTTERDRSGSGDHEPRH